MHESDDPTIKTLVYGIPAIGGAAVGLEISVLSGALERWNGQSVSEVSANDNVLADHGALAVGETFGPIVLCSLVAVVLARKFINRQ